MQIDMKHVAKLARLRIEEDQFEKFEKQMQDIIAMVENLPEISGSDFGVDPSNPMQLRKDEITSSLRRDEVLKNAPEVKAGCIVVPKTVEQ